MDYHYFPEYRKLKQNEVLALTSNTKFLPPNDPLYLKAAKSHRLKWCNYKQLLADSEQDTNMYQTHNLRNYTGYCPSCNMH